MLARSPRAVFPGLDAQTFHKHPLHAAERDWPETNCYMDLWIELLHAIGREPLAALGFTVAQDFEGDQFTFSKFPLEDLNLLYSVRVQELALYDTLEAHLATQIERGRMPMVEVDGFFLPDTRGTSYRATHTKTTIAVNLLDPAGRRMDYFHNAGFFSLAGEDYENLLHTTGEPGLLPYAEFVKFGCHDEVHDLRGAARVLLCKHIGERPTANPVAAFRTRIDEQAYTVAGKAADFFHLYAFNTLRQLGANFELLASHLDWLAEGTAVYDEAVGACRALSSGAKSFQFQLARAVARRRFDGLAALLDPLVARYDRALDLISHTVAT